MADKPVIIANDLQTILNETIQKYEELTGKTLQPAQAETLMLNSWAYREGLIRSQMQSAIESCFVDFAIAPALDYLGLMVGVRRLPAERATTTLRFTLTAVHTSGTILTGRKISSADGSIVFQCSESVNYTAEATTVDVPAQCTVEGVIGNGYIPGSLTVILEPNGAISTVTNLTLTAGGADAESDAQLRERIKLAPEAFSCAGSRQSYEYWAKTASQTIVDVYVASATAGVVTIYPLVTGGIVTPNEILTAVANICSGEKVRPLCDTVVVESPTKVEYSLTVNIRVAPGAVGTVVQDAVEAALATFTTAMQEKLGEDLYGSKIIGLCVDVEDCIDAALSGFSDQTPAANEFLKCTAITVNVI